MIEIVFAILAGIWAGIELMVYVLGITVSTLCLFVVILIMMERRRG